jgi:hypothetical protein
MTFAEREILARFIVNPLETNELKKGEMKISNICSSQTESTKTNIFKLLKSTKII